MDIYGLLWRLGLVGIRRLLMIIGVAISVIVLLQFLALPYGKLWSHSPSNEEVQELVLVKNIAFSKNLKSGEVHVVDIVGNGTGDSLYLEEKMEVENEVENMTTDYHLVLENKEDGVSGFTLKMGVPIGGNSVMGYVKSTAHGQVAQDGRGTQMASLPGISTHNGEKLDANSSTFDSVAADLHSSENVVRVIETQSESTKLLQTVSVTLKKNSLRANISILRRWRKNSTSISQMNLLLHQSLASFNSARPRWSSARDRELLSAKIGILNAPIIRNTPGLHASAFRNVSMFLRSYELMERLLKVYVYKEGEKPIFHQSKMRGIYASEGWFMKLLEGNKKFVVKDPRRAHLFYLPFSSQKLRDALNSQNFHSSKDLEQHLKKYIDLIARKYKFWNRTGGADHFLVGCHDWASRITRQYMGNCIRSLCNANVGQGFRIGKDTSLPVTYIRSAETPLKDLGGKPPSERSILAFFAGGMHGYLRPMLLQYWENKEPDMKIFGSLPRDLEGKRIYREYMKSSKYCLCARGYEVHTPRVVESIFYECVPVIISDNYVPPFFEVLNWEAFSVFVPEKDIPNLRDILLSIPEEKYIALQSGVRMVQQHFFWHKKPVKYDLFHMILHSVWYNRVFLLKSR